MLDAVTAAVQTVAADGLITFAENDVTGGCSTLHTPGASEVRITRPGVYLVSFNADVALPAGATVGPITTNAALRPGITGITSPIAGATATITPAAAADVNHIAFTKLIRINKSCPCNGNQPSVLTVVNASTQPVTYTQANLVVVKLS